MVHINRDVISGLVLSAFSIALYLAIIPLQVDSGPGGPVALSPRLFCHIIAVLLFLLSLGLIVSGLKTRPGQAPESSEKEAEGHPFTRGAATIAASAAYIVLINYLGYFLTTILAMIFFLYFFGARNWKGVLLFLVVIMPFIYALFVWALKVVLPEGFLF